jgi:hypothetical protein
MLRIDAVFGENPAKSNQPLPACGRLERSLARFPPDLNCCDEASSLFDRCQGIALQVFSGVPQFLPPSRSRGGASGGLAARHEIRRFAIVLPHC